MWVACSMDTNPSAPLSTDLVALLEPNRRDNPTTGYPLALTGHQK